MRLIGGMTNVRRAMLPAALLMWLCAAGAARAQEQGYWRAASSSAKDVTGDVAFYGEKLSINFFTTPAAEIRSLTPAEVSAVFDQDAATAGTGKLYRVSIPAEKKFLHKNTLCGGDDTQWVATYVTGRTLNVAFFSGAAMPQFTVDAISAGTNLCGTYTYAR